MGKGYSSGMSKSTYPRKVTDIKGKTAVNELRRAHWIIVVLALALAFIVTVGAGQEISFDGWLATVADVLLVLVALVSLATALRLKS